MLPARRMGGDARSRAEAARHSVRQHRFQSPGHPAGGRKPGSRHFVNEIADEIIDPETQAAIGNRTRAKLRVDALAPHATDEARRCEARRRFEEGPSHRGDSVRVGLFQFSRSSWNCVPESRICDEVSRAASTFTL